MRLPDEFTLSLSGHDLQAVRREFLNIEIGTIARCHCISRSGDTLKADGGLLVSLLNSPEFAGAGVEKHQIHFGLVNSLHPLHHKCRSMPQGHRLAAPDKPPGKEAAQQGSNGDGQNHAENDQVTRAKLNRTC